MTHGESELNDVIRASEIIFGNSTPEDLGRIPADMWEQLMDSLPSYQTVADPDEQEPHAGVSREQIELGLDVQKILWRTGFLSSSSEARRALQEGSISINKLKVTDEKAGVSSQMLIHGNYMLLQRGKKNYFLVKVVG